MKVRKHIYFSGRVQGVGFRYRARYGAESLGLTGWVKNLWDDRVEMEVQGEEREIDRLLEILQRASFIYISGMAVCDCPLKEESGFHIV